MKNVFIKLAVTLIVIASLFVSALAYMQSKSMLAEIKQIHQEFKNAIAKIEDLIVMRPESADQSNENAEVSLENQKQLAEKINMLINTIQSYQQYASSGSNDLSVISDVLCLQMDDLQTQLTQIKETTDLVYAKDQKDSKRIKCDLAEVLSQLDYLENSKESANITYADVYNYYGYNERPEPASEEPKESDAPEHVHIFDPYGNCTDATCNEHEEVEVFDLIDLKRADADKDYFYRIEWEGDINFEIIYSYLNTDDVEITLFSDEAHQNEVPMDRIDATYSTLLPEPGTYYIQLHTLTEGDIEISIY